MKTTDLISLILYELGEGDKYGFELTKSIENLTNGKIVIKQASLYAALKKLEKSKFISSYWQDSEIGGKRHYYKLTQNGNLQLSTMPNINTILNHILSDQAEDETIKQSTATFTPSPDEVVDLSFEQKNDVPVLNEKVNETVQEEKVSIMDMLLEENESRPNTQQILKESIIPTEEVFKQDSIDNLTETEINVSNATLLHNTADDKGEKFAENKNVTRFTENRPYEPLNLTDKLKSKPEIVKKPDQIQPMKIENDEIKFVDYINFKHTPKYIQANKLAKNMWYRLLCSSAYLILMLVICSVVANNTHSTVMGNIFLILGIVLIIFAPTIYAYRYDKFKTKCQEGKFKFDVKKRLISAVCVILAIMLIVVICNIALGYSSVPKLLAIKNFSNIYAPLIISSVILADLLFSYLFLKKSKK